VDADGKEQLVENDLLFFEWTEVNLLVRNAYCRNELVLSQQVSDGTIIQLP